MAIKSLTHYFDYKSPYAYLAQDETFLLEKEYNIRVDFLPLTLDIPQYLGSAEVDKDGQGEREKKERDSGLYVQDRPYGPRARGHRDLLAGICRWCWACYMQNLCCIVRDMVRRSIYQEI